MKRWFLFALLVTLTAVPTARPHEGHEHKAMGTLVAVDAGHLELATADGQTLSFQIAPETRFSRGKAVAALDALKLGERVVVMYVEKGGSKLARRVLLGAGKPASSPAPSPRPSPKAAPTPAPPGSS